MAEHPSLFGPIHQGHFRLFSGANAAFYADLVVFLDREVFTLSADPMRRKRLQSAIGDFIEEREWRTRLEDDRDALETGQTAQAIAYARLVACGWLVEHRDGVRTVVDMDSDAQLLLHALNDIQAGKVRAFGGEVLQVKTLVEAAYADPENSAQNIAAAGAQARRFKTNLRAITGALRKIEQGMKSEIDVAGIFRSFFRSYVTDTLVGDYKKLRARNNPYRFRHALVDTTERLSGDGPVLQALCEAYVREGRAPDPNTAGETILQDLHDIVDVFQSVDASLDLIEATNGRIERRLRNVARFSDRMGDDTTRNFLDAARALGKASMPAEAELPVGLALLDAQAPVDAASLYRARAKPRRTAPAIARRKAKDPALVRFEQDVRRYGERARITPEKIRAYLARRVEAGILAGGGAIRARHLKVVDLDDFFVFERLAFIPFAYAGRLEGIEVRRDIGGTIENAWISCRDFALCLAPGAIAPPETGDAPRSRIERSLP